MADVNRGNRPLSPHLSIYRPQLTSTTSILVRITGIAALAMSFFVVWWLLAASTSETAFTFIDSLMRSWLGDLVMFAATWAIFYHMLGRLRHLIWDLGYLVDVKISEKLGICMLVLATILTFITAVAV
ncbi:succinate dehydrogenase, cytochrome b556 subunit [Ruegeria halocynthiae]|uniref:succinate dehydrogenase, cytochrome b556 subunit n=1 Tax=Ruegeria halocynthiae TaxID=985054 RepID=UPI00055DE5DB|nr:succinate dehydrogenase, cytochrome b556 subunit [Ruegeria halocynthiae]